MLYCTELCYAVLYCTVLSWMYCTELRCAVLYCTELCFAVLYCTVLSYAVYTDSCAVQYCSALYCPVLSCLVLSSPVLFTYKQKGNPEGIHPNEELSYISGY